MEYSIFGCRLNKYYLNQWLEYFRSHDFAKNPYLITTCEVTDRAKQKRIKLAKKKLSEWCHIYITGCGSLKRGKVISTKQFYTLYPEFASFSQSITLLGEHPEHSLVFDASLSKNNIYTKKFVVIQNWCDNHCSFCLTVQKRGNHSSRSREDIAEEINSFVASGGKEVVLTGVNIAAWGCVHSTQPNQSQFADLLQYLLDHTTVERIRLSSLGPEYLHDDFFAVLQNPRILPHIHLSIQSFSDGVLHRMRRNYTAATLDYVLHQLHALSPRVPLSVWADIIVGFPWETQEEFQSTLEGIQRYHINKVHVFPFSDHHIGEKIPASSLPDQIDAATKKQREYLIQQSADRLEQEFLQSNRWLQHFVLVEGKWTWRTENYLKIAVDPKHKRGEIIQVIL